MAIFDIFIGIVLPIFLLIGVGFALDRRFRLDLPTLSKLNFYVFVPALLFVKLLEAQIDASSMGRIATFTAAHLLAMCALAYLVFSAPALRGRRTTMTLAAMFYNCGNYGIPLVILALGANAVAPLAVVIVVQNVATFTLGLFLFEKERGGALGILWRLVRIPVVIAVVAALALRHFDASLWGPIGEPLRYLAQGLVPVALLTLGAQLARSMSLRGWWPLAVGTALRLAVSPLVATGIALLLGFRGESLTLLVLVAGLPVAVNVYIVAAEYKRDERIASQAVFISTLLSALTVPILLMILSVR